jgi:hypothetical protein
MNGEREPKNVTPFAWFPSSNKQSSSFQDNALDIHFLYILKERVKAVVFFEHFCHI